MGKPAADTAAIKYYAACVPVYLNYRKSLIYIFYHIHKYTQTDSIVDSLVDWHNVCLRVSGCEQWIWVFVSGCIVSRGQDRKRIVWLFLPNRHLCITDLLFSGILMASKFIKTVTTVSESSYAPLSHESSWKRISLFTVRSAAPTIRRWHSDIIQMHI